MQKYTIQYAILNPKTSTLDCSDLRCNVCAYLVPCLFHFLVHCSLVFPPTSCTLLKIYGG
ncbi:hypothetical protein OIU74_002973 [Salix koriyanagi]|uniref:Uncharacterized protein n=1 Tax=Salix koriyanagi TaxID=2511006 RepID=A0A9Q0UWY5_9ROSI|nr:hypothetical protein OIU74_002973 [Salix koriyanagi]